MADAYWRFSDALQQPDLPPLAAKRPRPDYDVPASHDLQSHYARDDETAPRRVIRDSDPIGASYDLYLGSRPSYGGVESARPYGGGGPSSLPPVDDPRLIGILGPEPALAAKSRSMGFGGRPELTLPPNASRTLYVEGLPANSTRREVSHIFRPFVGYKEVRLVTKESRHPNDDPLVLCFVDFLTPAHAATALDALQGYKFDEHDRDSVSLRMEFSRNPGPRSGGGNRGGR